MTIIIKRIDRSIFNSVYKLSKKIFFNFDSFKKYSFVAYHNDIIIGYILSTKIIIVDFYIDPKYDYDNIGSALISNTLSQHLNNSLDICIKLTNNKKINLFTKIYNFKIINLSTNTIKVRLDNIVMKRELITQI